MNITEIRVTKTPDRGNQVAYASLTFDNEFVVKDVRILQSKEGALFISFPQRKKKDDTYEDIFFPLTKALRESIQVDVIAKYESLE